MLVCMAVDALPECRVEVLHRFAVLLLCVALFATDECVPANKFERRQVVIEC